MMVALTILRDRPRLQAPGVRPRITAVIGTNLIVFGVMFLPARGPLSMFEAVASSVLILAGSFFSVVVIHRLGRSFSMMAEARALVTDGPYKVIRHPLYLVEEIGCCWGIHPVCRRGRRWCCLSCILLFNCSGCAMRNVYCMRAFPREYGAYAARTARLIPGIW